MADIESRVARVRDIAGDALIAIVGPTASGKTELAIRVAEELGGEIVSADSVQIYERFDIGSGKPTSEERARARHHLIDAKDPLEPLDAARFADMARAAILDIEGRGKRAILCGGTFLWAKALLYGLAEAPPANPVVRARHRAIVDAEGRTALHVLLKAVDPRSADRLHPNDLVRVSRALEVHELSGRALSEWQSEHAAQGPRIKSRLIAISLDADTQTARIEARARTWLESGWLEEEQALLDAGYENARAMGSVGYREVRLHLQGALAKDDLHRAIVRSTRIFARRQRTFLNHTAVTWLE